MSNRTRLPNRRACETFGFTLAGMAYTASVGFDERGRPLEIFLGAAKSGTDVAIATQEAAILTSLALQYGVPLDVLRGGALRTEAGTPEGAVGHLIDLIWHRINAKPPEAVT